MSESESEPGGISDEDLPEDLQPGEDNPLAEPLDTEDVDRDDLDLAGGKAADPADEAATETSDEEEDEDDTQ
jgi:hypothetical protein